MEYRISTVRSRDSGRPVGYFDRWHSLVTLGEREVGYGQGFTKQRAERRARKIASEHERALRVRHVAHGAPVRESVFSPGGGNAPAGGPVDSPELAAPELHADLAPGGRLDDPSPRETEESYPAP
jgi:hypothetical protein